ncbi:hypothetical protein SEUCBS139899_001510 [Sporothrix eucalyptigena]|uniref:Amidase domain-containing protein n=1 Tax=Sporothrix eucalyptigena TaxID=1812306 RepID=A0ABP0BKB8_9PEZI
MAARTLNLVEASVAELQDALASGAITSVELVALYLRRISAYDCRGPSLNAIPIINTSVFDEAGASDDRRRNQQQQSLDHKPPPLEGIPFTVKDSYRVKGMTVASGSPAFEHLVANDDAHTVQVLRDPTKGGGAVLLGRTNMPPMAYGGMQRGIYGRAESPYSADWLAAAYASGSSNGSGAATAASFAAFGMGEETVSSGRSPASNNALAAYTPSRGWLSLRGNWPLYLTRDVVVPHTRTMEDMLTLVGAFTGSPPDPETAGDFWRDQPFMKLPTPWPNGRGQLGRILEELGPEKENWLAGVRIAVPGMYIGKPPPAGARPVTTTASVVALWETARRDLEALGATVTVTPNFPAVTAYESPDDPSLFPKECPRLPPNWHHLETGPLIAHGWNDFLKATGDPKLPDLSSIEDPWFIYPDSIRTTTELRRLDPISALQWTRLHEFLKPEIEGSNSPNIYDTPGLAELLEALEAQRKVLLEDWLAAVGCDVVAFPAAGDVGPADADVSEESATHAYLNGVYYSNGNRAIRHLGIPTVTVPMGVLTDRDNMPMGLTLAGRAYDDAKLLRWAYAYETATRRRAVPLRTPALQTDTIELDPGVSLLDRAPRPGLIVEAKIVEEGEAEDDSAPVTVSIQGTTTISPGGRGLVPNVDITVDGVDVPGKLVNIEESSDDQTFQFSVEATASRPVHTDPREKTIAPVARDKIMVVVMARAAKNGCPSGWLKLL